MASVALWHLGGDADRVEGLCLLSTTRILIESCDELRRRIVAATGRRGAVFSGCFFGLDFRHKSLPTIDLSLARPHSRADERWHCGILGIFEGISIDDQRRARAYRVRVWFQ